MVMKTSQNGVDLIKSFEGLVLHAYKPLDSEHEYTIGYGHYGSDVRATDKITKSEAEELLKKDLKKYEDYVNDYVTVKLNQNQFDALVSFCYNLGGGAFQHSTLLIKLNRGDYKGASNEFQKWVNAGGKKLAGLVKRRLLERDLFLKPVFIRVVKPKLYTVKEGDSLSEIATKYKTTVAKILMMNPSIKDKNKIFVGQKITVSK